MKPDQQRVIDWVAEEQAAIARHERTGLVNYGLAKPPWKIYTYGLDERSRYVEVEGERYAIEPYPFWRKRYLWHDVLSHVVARWGILRWFWATRHQRHLWRY